MSKNYPYNVYLVRLGTGFDSSSQKNFVVRSQDGVAARATARNLWNEPKALVLGCIKVSKKDAKEVIGLIEAFE